MASVGNKRNMVVIDSDYVRTYLNAYCKSSSTSFAALSRELGHTSSYLKMCLSAGKIPVCELKLLESITGLPFIKVAKSDSNKSTCPYCAEEPKDLGCIDFGKLGNEDLSVKPWIYTGSYTALAFSFDGCEVWGKQISINYCPMCGRKLEERS